MDALTFNRADWLRLGGVLAIALVVRTWIVANTEVCARDSIGFIRYALLLDERPWPSVIRDMHQMPGYPAAILVMSKPVLALHAGPRSEALMQTAQIVSLLASLATIPAIYLTGRWFGSRNIGFFAALLFQMLPGWLLVTSDGLSEALFLMFAAWAAFFTVDGLRSPSNWRFSFAGIAIGLSYATRPEGAELILVAGLIVVIFGLASWGWRPTTLRLASLAAGAAPFLVTYVAITGTLTNKPTGRTLLGDEPPASTVMQGGPPSLLFAAFLDPSSHSTQSRALWGVKMLGAETAKSLRYAAVAFAIAGIALACRRLRRDPACWLFLILAAVHALVLWRMAVVIGYLSERHTLLLVLPALFFAGIALEAARRWLSERAPAWRFAPLVVVVIVGLSGIGELAKPLHHNRAGHHAAGRWLAANCREQDELIDPFAWAHYYGDFFFREGRQPPPGDKATYVVVEHGGNAHARLPLMASARRLAQLGEPVFEWRQHKRPNETIVAVYRIKARD